MRTKNIPEHKPIDSSNPADVSGLTCSPQTSPSRSLNVTQSEESFKVTGKDFDFPDGAMPSATEEDMDQLPPFERPLMVVTDESLPKFSQETQHDNKVGGDISRPFPAPISPNDSINSDVFDEDEDLDPTGAKRKCREETKIHPYERQGQSEFFRCPLCSADGIESRKSLTCHLRLHQNKERRDDGKHLCCLCSHELSSNSSLERHLLTHTNFRPFSCRFCTKAFTTNGNLSRHVKTTHDTSVVLDLDAKSPRKSKTPKKTSTVSKPSDDIFDIIKCPEEPLDIQAPPPAAPVVPSVKGKPGRKSSKSQSKKADLANLTNISPPLATSMPGVSGPQGLPYYTPANGYGSPLPAQSAAANNDALTAQLAAALYFNHGCASGPGPTGFPYPPVCSAAVMPTASHPFNPLYSHHHLQRFVLPPGLSRMPTANAMGMFGLPPVPGALQSLPQSQLLQMQSSIQGLKTPPKSGNRAGKKSRDNTPSNNNNNTINKKHSNGTKKAGKSVNHGNRKRQSIQTPSTALGSSGGAKKPRHRSPSSTNGEAGCFGLDLSIPPAVKQEAVFAAPDHCNTVPLALIKGENAAQVDGVNSLVCCSKEVDSGYNWCRYQRLQRRVARTRQYFCSQCSKTFNKAGGLVHQLRHHPSPSGRHYCSMCGFNCRSTASFLGHYRGHMTRLSNRRLRSAHQRFVYRCWASKSCPAKFPSMAECAGHIRRDHHLPAAAFFTPERPTDEDVEHLEPPVHNSTPLDFSSRVNLGDTLEVEDDHAGVLDLSVRNSTHSLHLTGLSDTGNLSSPEELDFSADCFRTALPRVPLSHTVMCQSGYTPFVSLATSALHRSMTSKSSGFYAMRKPHKKSNLSKPQLNPDLVRSGFNFAAHNNNNNNDNSDKCCAQKSAAMFSGLPHFPATLPLGRYMPDSGPLPGRVVDENDAEDDALIHKMKLVRKKNSYKDAPKLITCPVPGCKQKFPWHSSLKRHIITHTEHKPYKCTRCHKSFSTKSNRERHMERLHGVSVKKHKRHQLSTELHHTYINDDSCSEGGASSTSQISETSFAGLQPQMSCSGHPALTDSELKEEEILSMDTNDRQAETISTTLLMQAGTPQVEPNPERYSGVSGVPISSAGSANSSHRARKDPADFISPPYRPWAHGILGNTSPPPPPPPSVVTCSTCGLQQDSVKSLRKHEKLHLTDAPYKCPLCAQAHSSRLAALDHLREVHSSEWAMLVAKIGISRVEDLLAKFHTPPSHQQQQQQQQQQSEPMIDEMGAVSLARHVQCCVCLHRFWSFQDLQRHMRSHTGERPFTCSVCGKEFSLKHSMQRHMRVHTEGSQE